MRTVFKEFINKIGKDKKVVLITGDVGKGVIDDFVDNYPDRFFNIGICEQSMIGLAAGLALEGMIPYVFTIAPFIIERAFEQVKMDIESMNANVKLIGTDYQTAGISHSCLDEKKLMSCFKNILSLYPENKDEALLYLEQSYLLTTPCYVSLRKI